MTIRKKKNVFMIILILILIMLLVISCIIFFSKNKLKATYTDNTNNSDLDIDYTTDKSITEEKIDKYLDNNEVKIGIYTKEGNNLKLIKDEYNCSWSAENVMGLFYVIPTIEDTIPFENFDTMWKGYINEYSNASNCRIGYNLKFTLNTGEVIDKTILNPTDAYYMFPKVMVFLYDDVNLIPNKPYYHITDMSDDTICSSIKLVGDVESQNIASKIELTAFCFDSSDDFDEITNKYRGNSSYKITIDRW